jgi:photosystem II stability/assembly factor-like uncharacterized protein
LSFAGAAAQLITSDESESTSEAVMTVSLRIGPIGIVVLSLTVLACSGRAPSTDDAGTGPWSVINLSFQDALYAPAFLSVRAAGADLYLGGGGFALRSSSSGRTWSPVVPASFAAGTDYVAIAATAEDDVWLAGKVQFGQGQWLHSADRGNSWQLIDVGSFSPSFGIWSIDRTHVLITTQDGQIRKTADAGATWAAVFSDSSLALFGVWGSAASADLYVVGGAAPVSGSSSGSGVILHSADGGDTWQDILDSLTCPLWSVSGTSDGANVSAAGDCGTVAITTDHGLTWATSGVSAARGDFGIKGVWVSPTGTSYFLPFGDGFYSDPFHAYSVCRSVQVNDRFVATGGCEMLPRYMGGTSSPTAIWGTSDDDIWVTGEFLWHHR